MSSDWRKQVEITFPIYRYHPAIHGVCLDFAYFDAPCSVIGPPYHQFPHGGRGLSRAPEFPCREHILPGGILDAAGRHIPILDIDAPDSPPWLPLRLPLALFGILRTYRYRYSFDEPEQLSLDDYKTKLLAIIKAEKLDPHSRRPVRRIKAAESFLDIHRADLPEVLIARYHKTALVKNWIDEPKSHRSER